MLPVSWALIDLDAVLPLAGHSGFSLGAGEDIDESGVTPARPTWPGDMEKGKELSA